VPARPAPSARSLEDVHLDELLRVVVQKNGSDLHVTVGVPPVIRLDGALRALSQYVALDPNTLRRMVYDILQDHQIERFERTMELDTSYAMPSGEARFRVNVFKTRGNVAAAFRLISARVPTIRELGLPLMLEELARKPRGLIISTGPTGAGKTTTQAAIINQINCERSMHIITIEDPIEYLHQHRLSIINQRELGQDTQAFDNALRAALREDPDVILVGEMRDRETMQLAVTAAETGHLVITTLHTSTTAQAVDRIVDVFPSGQQDQIRIQLANTLLAVLAQQLLPRANAPGRVAAMEVLIANAAVRNLIREAKAHQITSTLQTSTGEGMQSMDQALALLYRTGYITYEDAIEHSVNPEECKKLMRAAV
jgi:twitching motility protein PilT